MVRVLFTTSTMNTVPRTPQMAVGVLMSKLLSRNPATRLANTRILPESMENTALRDFSSGSYRYSERSRVDFSSMLTTLPSDRVMRTLARRPVCTTSVSYI
ncbi:MAG: hypothetical protein ABIJ95_11200 [Pseudomonadota bacterium]